MIFRSAFKKFSPDFAVDEIFGTLASKHTQGLFRGGGFAASLARPGGNITGLSNIVVDLSLKRLELPRLIVPRLSRLAILVNPDNKAAAPTLNIMQTATRASVEALGIQVQPVSARTAEDIERAFAIMLQERTEGVIVAPDIFFYQQRQQIIQLVTKHRIPAIFHWRNLSKTAA